ncbi:hypothetical protein BaRGS_00025277 [Batillaria attramentaria]|uniref:RNA polymerase II subunit B1 CTD phosphatase RPAP2 homolog n=1 Tax=Batillaria attramentaria TaxID=370345 RepID=A0ABD0K8S9_9CAEN
MVGEPGKSSMEKPHSTHKKQETEDHRKAELERKVRHRVACEAKAFDIVNRLLETPITEDYLKEACQFISRSHYEDIVEERAIGHLCGYPLCGNTLSNIPKKKYHISTKSNRVFDITERKNFCSNQCYRASKYLQMQVPDTPVWGRENDPRVNYELLSTAGSRGDVGEEVVGLSLVSLKQEVLALEKLDRCTQETKAAPANKKQARDMTQKGQKNPESVPVSAQIPDEDEGLNKKMNQLSLDKGDNTRPSTRTSGGECVVPSDGSLAKSEKTVLEHSMKDLSITESGSHTEVDSDDDVDAAVTDTSSYGVGTQTSVSKDDSLMADSSSQSRTAAIQSESVTDQSQSTKPHIQSTYQGVEKSGNTLASSAGSVKTNETVGQEPGESSAAYLMRLLDKKKKLLSKMADIQPSAVDQSGFSHSNTDIPPVSDGEVSSDMPGHKIQKSLATDLPREKVTDARPQAKKKPSPKPSQPKTSPLEAVCLIIRQWVTEETLTYLGIRPSDGHEDTPRSFHNDPEMQRKYQNLCQRLAGQEKDFEEVLGEEEVGSGDREDGRKPLPHFEELTKQTAEFQLKVTEFLRGPTPQKKKLVKQGDEGDGAGCASDKEPSHERPIVLPAVDSHNQQLIRRRIVLDRLNHSISALLPPLGLGVQDVSGILRELVFTFSFTSQNIVFKPAEWSLVSFILLKMLAFKSSQVAGVFDSEVKGKTLDIVLSRLGHSSASLSSLVHNMLMEQEAVN